MTEQTERQNAENQLPKIAQRIYSTLSSKFGMTGLQERMIFTACSLIAGKYEPDILKVQKSSEGLYDAICRVLESRKAEVVLLEEYDKISVPAVDDEESITDYVENIVKLIDIVNRRRGEDIMAALFSELSRYKKKSDAGQVFTPDHITGFICKLLNVTAHDKVLDATCGSGSFLVKAMSLMDNANTSEMSKTEQLFGIELYREVYALACANKLLLDPSKFNLTQLDAKSEEAGAWIRSKNITKVLMNPPYEAKYGCLKIVKNVMDNVEKGTACAFILPDKKLEKDSLGKKLLKDHTLKTIIKLPENLFFGVGVTTSIFIFEAGNPQGDKNITGYYMEDDGLETVKNQGRHDVKNRWPAIETEWVKIITEEDHEKCQIIDPSKNLSYQMPEKPFEISEEDFMKTMMDYKMFERGIDVKKFKEEVVEKVFYGSNGLFGI